MKLLPKTSLIALSLALMGGAVVADEAFEKDMMMKARDYRSQNERQILEDFVKLLSLPNDAGIDGQVEANAAYIRGELEKRGVKTQLLQAGNGAPTIYGVKDVPGATKTVTFYIHYDGQAVDKSNWASDPFDPTMYDGKLLDGAKSVDWRAHDGAIPENWRLYGRSASDDKAPIIGMLTALDILEKNGVQPSVNLRFFLEGEEEKGSPSLKQLIEENADTLKSDFWIFMDGPQDLRGNPRTVLGVRGSMGGSVTVYGPNTGLHSGHYGNFAPNAITMMAHLLASMREESGKVNVKGFYDGVTGIDASTQKLLDAIPDGNKDVLAQIGAGRQEFPGTKYEATHLYPALNFQGMKSGNIGKKARNIIEPEAEAAIGVRLVTGQDPQHVADVIDEHIKGQGYHIIRQDPTDEERMKHPKLAKVVWRGGYKSVRTSVDNIYAKRLTDMMDHLTDGENLTYPTMGGSLPLAHIVDALHVPLVILPIANADNSQHAPNENIRIGNLWRGIEYYTAILAGFDKE